MSALLWVGVYVVGAATFFVVVAMRIARQLPHDAAFKDDLASDAKWALIWPVAIALLLFCGVCKLGETGLTRLGSWLASALWQAFSIPAQPSASRDAPKEPNAE